jgi:hypothetical protein
MAIVRRHQIAVGRAAVPVTTVYTPTPAPGIIPQQPGPGDGATIGATGAAVGAHAAGARPTAPGHGAAGHGAAGHGAPGHGAPGYGAPGQADAATPPADPAAVAVPTLPAHPLAVLAGLGLAVWGGILAMGVTNLAAPPVFRVDNQMATFGALFAAAAAVERVLEPITRWMPGRRSNEKYEHALAAVANGIPGAIHAAATAKAQCERDRSSRGVIMWGLATAVATVLSSSAGFYLLHALSADPQWDAVPRWADALITGLVVGSGTKPLHDLLNRVQRKGNDE